MVRSAHVVHVAELLTAVICLAGCGGNVIRLGNGRGGGCPHAQVNADEVAWIGDSWVTIPGTQHTGVRDLARAAGAIGPSDDYVILAAAANTMSMIANQYNTQEAGATKVKVLIMNGGGWDLIAANGSDASISSVVTTFEQHLAKVASDGTVQHIIYYLYPEIPTTPGVAALHPGVQQACAQSTVPCHFLDLQPLWVGHSEYTAADGVQASNAGAQVIANAIWSIMQQHCIAQ